MEKCHIQNNLVFWRKTFMDGWQNLWKFASSIAGQPKDNPRLRQSLLKQRKTIVFHTLDDVERIESFGMFIATVQKLVFKSDIKIVSSDWTLSPKQQTNKFAHLLHNGRLTNAVQFVLLFTFTTKHYFLTLRLRKRSFGLTRECPIKLCLACSSLQDSGENGSKGCTKKPSENWGERLSSRGQFSSAPCLFLLVYTDRG